MRRNPVIADLFHRMKYMERRGSGLRKIVSETEKLPGYTEAYKPEFSSTATDFRVILKNVNYNLEGDTHQVTHQDIELSTMSKPSVSAVSAIFPKMGSLKCCFNSSWVNSIILLSYKFWGDKITKIRDIFVLLP